MSAYKALSGKVTVGDETAEAGKSGKVNSDQSPDTAQSIEQNPKTKKVKLMTGVQKITRKRKK